LKEDALKKGRLKVLSIAAPLGCVVLFVLFAWMREAREHRVHEARLAVFMKILGDSLYDLDEQGALAQINAVFLMEPGVRSIRLRHASGDVFLFRESPLPMDGLLQALAQLDLLSRLSVEEEVKVKGELIGVITIAYFNDSLYGLLCGAALAAALAIAGHQYFARLALAGRKDESLSALSLEVCPEASASTLVEEIQRTSALLRRANSILSDTHLSQEQEECARHLRRGEERLTALALYAAQQSAPPARVDPNPPQEAPANVVEEKQESARPTRFWSMDIVQETLGIDLDELPQYLRISLDELERRVDLCHSALENENMSEAVLHAHTLKSTSGSLSLEGCRELALQLEKFAASGDREQAKRLLGRYENALRIDRIPILQCLEQEGVPTVSGRDG
jgi:HPt (histidine-containing phosphotransfer) domain-containing protein